MKLTLETTYVQTIEIEDERGMELISDWQNGDTTLVEPLFDEAKQYGYQTRLYVEAD